MKLKIGDLAWSLISLDKIKQQVRHASQFSSAGWTVTVRDLPRVSHYLTVKVRAIKSDLFKELFN